MHPKLQPLQTSRGAPPPARAVRLQRGVHAEAVAQRPRDQLLQRALAAKAVCPPGTLVGGAAGLALLLRRTPPALTDQAAATVPVLVPPGWRGPRRAGITNVRTSTPPVAWEIIGGVPIAHPAGCWLRLVAEWLNPTGIVQAGFSLDPEIVPDAWVDAHAHRRRPPARIQDRPGVFATLPKRRFLELVELGDALMRRHNPILAHTAFAAFLDSRSGARGVETARVVFSHCRPGTDSLEETHTRLIAVDAGFAVPKVNLGVTARDGRTRYLDMAWPAELVDLEFQGIQHFTEAGRAWNDLVRRGAIRALGWRQVEATSDDLRDPGPLIKDLRTMLPTAHPNRFTERRHH
jgi:hypothetical protein